MTVRTDNLLFNFSTNRPLHRYFHCTKFGVKYSLHNRFYYSSAHSKLVYVSSNASNLFEVTPVSVARRTL